MHFRAYTMKHGYNHIKTDKSEYVVCIAIGEILKQDPEERILIVRNKNKGDETYKSIEGKEEYEKYRSEVESRRLSELSVMELRKEMMDIVYDKPKVKTKKI